MTLRTLRDLPETRRARIGRRALLGAACVLAAAFPLGYGAVPDEVWSLAAIAAAGLLVLWPFSLEGRPPEAWTFSGRLAFAAGLVLLVLAFVQVVPWPRGLLEVASPATVEVRDAAAGSLGEPPPSNWLVPSLSPARSRAALVKLATCLVLVLVVASSLRSRRELMAAMGILVLGAMIEAAYGLRQTLAGTETIWEHAKVHYRGDVTGTYVNRNHLAGLLAIALPLAMTLAIARPRRSGGSPESWRRSLVELFGNRRSIALAVLSGWAVLVLAVCLLLSHSRWGAVGGAAGVLVLVSFYLARRSRRVYGVILLVLLTGGVVLAARRVGLDRAEERIRALPTDQASVGDRWTVWRSTIAIAADHPVLGTGPGTFRDVFPAYRPATIPTAFHHAHNEYLNLASDLGLPGLVLALALLSAGVVQLASQARGADRFGRDVSAGLLSSLAALAVLSAADFHLQIQANAMFASVVLGLAIGCGKRIRTDAPYQPHVLGRRRIAASALALAVALPLVVTAWRFHQAAHATPYLPHSIRRTDAAEFEARLEGAPPEERARLLAEARAGFEDVLDHVGDDGWAWGELADALERAGASTPAEADRVREAAERAVRAQPTEARHHLRLGAIHYRSGRLAAADRAMANARRFGRSDSEVLRHTGRYELRRAVEEGSTERLERGLADWRRAGSIVPDRDLESILREARARLPDARLRLAVVPGSEEARRKAFGIFRRDGETQLAVSVGRLLPRTSPDLALELARLHLALGDPAGAVESWTWGLELAEDRDAFLEEARQSAARYGGESLVRFVAVN